MEDDAHAKHAMSSPAYFAQKERDLTKVGRCRLIV
jgi:hypothetical protein